MRKIDKKNGNICFNDDEHVYWDLNNPNDKFISVTTLIEKYSQGFDKNFWSAYKALEKIMSPEQFRMEKGRLLKTKKYDIDELVDIYDIDKDAFNSAQQDILDEWQKKNIEACKRGTKIHSEMEHSFTNKKHTDLKRFGIGGKFVVNTNDSLEKQKQTLESVEKGVFPEFLIYSVSKDGILKLAGQIDLLVKDGNDIYILDFKTNNELKFHSNFNPNTKKNQTMKYPLTTIEDCNMGHYTMQLSTYAWMVQKINPNFKIKKLIIEHHDHSGEINLYELEYKKAEVERMLRDYKKKLILKDRADKRKAIKF